MARRHRLLFYDLESSFVLAPVWRAHDSYVAPERLRHDSFLLTFAAKWADQPHVYYGRLTPEEAVAKDDRRIAASIGWLLRQADWAVAHNGDRFDKPLLNSRLLQHELPSVQHVQTIDTLKLARRSFKLAGGNGLDYLAQFLGLGSKIKVGFDAWEAAYRGDPQALRDLDMYCRHDVRLLEQVYERMAGHVSGLPRLVSADEPEEFCCTRCGSPSVQKRGFHYTRAATYQRYRCMDCGKWDRDPIAMRDKRLALRPV